MPGYRIFLGQKHLTHFIRENLQKESAQLVSRALAASEALMVLDAEWQLRFWCWKGQRLEQGGHTPCVCECVCGGGGEREKRDRCRYPGKIIAHWIQQRLKERGQLECSEKRSSNSKHSIGVFEKKKTNDHLNQCRKKSFVKIQQQFLLKTGDLGQRVTPSPRKEICRKPRGPTSRRVAKHHGPRVLRGIWFSAIFILGDHEIPCMWSSEESECSR